MGRDVGIAASRGVVEGVELGGESAEVGGDDGVLVGGAGEVVAEAAAAGEFVGGVEGDDLGVDVPGGADGGHVGLGTG